MNANLGIEIAHLMLWLRDSFEVREFIETGTNFGNTAEWASDNFEQVYTIEMSEKIYSRALDERGHIENIEFICGTSQGELGEVLEQVERPSIIYLDAHCGSVWEEFDGEDAGLANATQCPLLDELDKIIESGEQHFIFIDDEYSFTSPRRKPYSIEDWPSLQEIIDKIETIDPSYYVMVYDGAIIGIPPSAKDATREKVSELKAQDELSRANEIEKSFAQQLLWDVWVSVVQPAAKRFYRLLS